MPPPAHTPAAGGGNSLLSSSSTSTSLPPPLSPLSPSTSTFSHSQSPPPLPPSLVPAVDSLERILEDLQSYQIPQLADCRGPKSLFDQLTNQVRNELSRCKRDLEELKLEVEDLTKSKDRQNGFWHLEQLQLFFDQCQKGYRSSVVQAKRVIDSSQHYLAREELLAPSSNGRDSPAPPNNKSAASQSGDDALMSATSDVTEGLRRTLQLLQSEVDRSQVSNELLEQQTSTIASTTEQYSKLSNLLTNSKNLITSLERADILDRLILFGAFSFFIGVCSYIFKKRVVDRGLKVASAVGGILGKTPFSSSGEVGRVEKAKQVGEAVRSEFRGEIEKVAMATAAVVGAVKKARNVVQEKLKERSSIEGKQQGTILEEVVDRVEDYVKSTSLATTPTTSEPFIQASSSTLSSTTSDTVPPIPTSFSDFEEQLDYGDEEDDREYVESDDDKEPLVEEVETTSRKPLHSSYPEPTPSPTSAIELPEPTSTSTPIPSRQKEEEEEEEEEAKLSSNVYSPDPTPEPSPIQYSEVEDSSTVKEVATEPSAEPEAEIELPEIPESTIPSSKTDEDHEPSPTPSLELDLDNNMEAIKPRQIHPPVPSHTTEELDDIFDDLNSSSSQTVPELEVDTPDSDLADDMESISKDELPTASPSAVDLDPLPSFTVSFSSISDDSLPPAAPIETASPNIDHTTTPLDNAVVDSETIPRLDVEETGQVFQEGGNESGSFELPIDLDKEQTIWKESTARNDDDDKEAENLEEEAREDEQDGERLLEEMMEMQMDRSGGGRFGGIVGSSRNGTEVKEESPKAEDTAVGDSVTRPAVMEKEEDLLSTTATGTRTEEEPEVEEPLPEAVPEPTLPSSMTETRIPASPTSIDEVLDDETLSNDLPSATTTAPDINSSSSDSTPASSVVYESIPPQSVERLEDVELEQSTIPDPSAADEDIIFDHEGSTTDPSLLEIFDEPEAGNSAPSDLPFIPSSSPHPSEEPLVVSHVEEAAVPAEEEQEEEEEIIPTPPVLISQRHTIIDDIPLPTPAPAPTPTPAPIPTPSAEEAVEAYSTGEPGAILEVIESEEPVKLAQPPLPKEEPTPSPSSSRLSNSSPSPIPATVPPSSSKKETVLLDDEDLTNSDVIYPEADIDEPSLSTTANPAEEEEEGTVFERSEEGGKEGSEELNFDEQVVPVAVFDTPTHVEL